MRALVETPEERIASAVAAGLHSYDKQFPERLAAEPELRRRERFFSDFLKMFLELERKEWALEQVHANRAGREAELVDEVHRLRELCAKKIREATK